MDGDISQSVGLVTALGMGTVFICLVLLYFMTRGLGSLLTEKPEPAPEPASPGAADAAVAVPADAAAESDHAALLAAMTLVLARHRASRTRPAATRPGGGDDPWKIAGRIGMLR